MVDLPSRPSSTNTYPSRPGEESRRPPSSLDETDFMTVKDSLHTPNIPTPTSYFTPLASPGEELSKGLGIEFYDTQQKADADTSENDETRQVMTNDATIGEQDVQVALDGHRRDDLDGRDTTAVD